jgi:hypothetical protein
VLASVPLPSAKVPRVAFSQQQQQQKPEVPLPSAKVPRLAFFQQQQQQQL